MKPIADDLLLPNPYSRGQRAMGKVLAIVVHYVNNPGTSAKQTRDYFASLAKPAHPDAPVYASSHYIVGLTGEIFRSVPEAEVAFHAGSTTLDPASGRLYTDQARALFGPQIGASVSPNGWAIGIEVCHPDVGGKFNDDTLHSVVDLVALLCVKYKVDPFKAVVRHKDVVGWKECPVFYVKHPEEWDALRRLVVEAIAKQKK